MSLSINLVVNSTEFNTMVVTDSKGRDANITTGILASSESPVASSAPLAPVVNKNVPYTTLAQCDSKRQEMGISSFKTSERYLSWRCC